MFWPETFPPAIGGVEVLAAKLLPDLRERGYDFIVVTPSEDVAETADYAGIPVHRFPFWGALRAHNLEQMMRLRQQLAQLKRALSPTSYTSTRLARATSFST